MSEPAINWTWKRFQEFSATELYELLGARVEIFVVEQNCAYQELDGLDFQAHHLCGLKQGCLAAYLRLLPAGDRYPGPSIGRVMTVSSARGGGLGRELMIRGIRGCREYFPGQALRVSAQAHLETFYTSIGFKTVSPCYTEDGIPHLDMLLDPDQQVRGLV